MELLLLSVLNENRCPRIQQKNILEDRGAGSCLLTKGTLSDSTLVVACVVDLFLDVDQLQLLQAADLGMNHNPQPDRNKNEMH